MFVGVHKWQFLAGFAPRALFSTVCIVHIFYAFFAFCQFRHLQCNACVGSHLQCTTMCPQCIADADRDSGEFSAHIYQGPHISHTYSSIDDIIVFPRSSTIVSTTVHSKKGFPKCHGNRSINVDISVGSMMVSMLVYNSCHDHCVLGVFS